MATKVNYKKIYEALEDHKGKTITPSMLAYKVGVERIYGATMMKLVRDGALEKCPADGYYRVILE